MQTHQHVSVLWVPSTPHSYCWSAPLTPLPLNSLFRPSLQECGGMQTHKLLWGFSDYRCGAVRGRPGGQGRNLPQSGGRFWG